MDAEGRIHGHGHPTRDALGWTPPLLWPAKLVALPLRNPRPTLKGELRVMLRLLDDVDIPRDAFLSNAALRNTQGEESNQLQTQSGNPFPRPPSEPLTELKTAITTHNCLRLQD